MVYIYHDYWEDATRDTVEFLYKLRVFETFISIQVLLKAFNSLFAPKLLFIEVFGVSVQLYLDLYIYIPGFLSGFCSRGVEMRYNVLLGGQSCIIFLRAKHMTN